MKNITEIFSTERQKLYDRMQHKLITATNLSRKVVSFQANKDEPVYRWFKYKEGFASTLVKYFLTEFSPKPGKILDPFAGAGTALFAAQELGWQAFGIELLPVGVFVMRTREAINSINIDTLREIVKNILTELKKIENYETHINHISITKDAFPNETEVYLNKYLTYCSKITDKSLQTILRFAALAILEEMSFTRKDGQYLRWDSRSKRDLSGKPFDKGKISSFEEALKRKLNEIATDLRSEKSNSLFDDFEKKTYLRHPVTILQGTCLEELPKLQSDYFDFIITSPPYCNRYDYTRTYALELMYLGYNSEQVRDLRQTMLSCTVENKEKVDYLKHLYSSIGRIETFNQIQDVYNDSTVMREVNDVLEELSKLERLNNNNIPRMVKNYFFELCFVISEMARVTKRNGYCVMVNDNVRYGGEDIPVDLILSKFAEQLGYNTEKIFVLPTGKGNSSQQMGDYGRTETRKCVYIWQKR